MKNYIRDYLTFTRRERSGVLLLLSLCLLGYGISWTYPFLINKPEVDFGAFEKAVAALESAEKPSTPVSRQVLFPFDPNTASSEELQSLGFSRKTAQTVLNYRRKGGRFYRKSDLQKIYNLPDSLYSQLEPYIRLGLSRPARQAVMRKEAPVPLFYFDPQTVSESELRRLGLSEKVARTFVNFRRNGGAFHKEEDLLKVYGMKPQDARRLAPYARFPKKEHVRLADSAARNRPAQTVRYPVLLDINQADAGEWQRLYGIGPVLSSRIVRFREKLGGFASVSQLRETYGLPDSTYEKIHPHLRGSPIFRPLAVNQLDWEALSEHPYLKRRQAQALVSYRRQHGPFSSVEELGKVAALSGESLAKLAPYWSFE